MVNEIPEQVWELVYERYLKAPETIKLAIPGVGVLDKNAILYHIKRRDEIGRIIVMMEWQYLRFLMR